MDSVNIRTISNDNRGVMLSGEVNGQEKFLIVEIKKDQKRGGHYHDIETFHFVLVGKITYREKYVGKNGNPTEDKELQKILRMGEGVKTPAYAAHLLEAVEDSVIVEGPSGTARITTSYDQYRNLIKKD